MDSGLYNRIGNNYNSTRRADAFISQRLYELVMGDPGQEKIYLDIGCGTGNYTIALSQKSMKFYGVDPSERMLEQARNKDDKVVWQQGEAENIPLETAIFSGAIATLTLHHWSNLGKGLSEVYRVLRSNAKFVVFTATQEQMEAYWLNHYFPEMMRKSIDKMPTRTDLITYCNEAGFHFLTEERYFINNQLQDLFLYSGKHQPEMYFSEQIRAGISSFAQLSDPDEVARGLSQLSADLKSERFQYIKESYLDVLGDYSFFVYEKNVSENTLHL